MRVVLLLFIVIPIVEMWGLIKVGSAFGAWTAIFLVFATAMIGVAMLRRQGISTLMRAQSKAAQGQLPLHEMVEGVFFAVAGALLLTPGFFTDAIGFACLIPGLRHLLIGWGGRHLLKGQFVRMQTAAGGFGQGFSHRGNEEVGGGGSRSGYSGSQSEQGETLDGEYTREDKIDDRIK